MSVILISLFLIVFGCWWSIKKNEWHGVLIILFGCCLFWILAFMYGINRYNDHNQQRHAQQIYKEINN